MKPYRTVLLSSLIAVMVAAPAVSEETASLLRAFSKGQPVLDLRYRYEDVRDEGNGDKHARASTLRTVVGFRTLSWRGMSLYLEAENITPIGNDLYDNAGSGALSNGVTDRPVVADPQLTEINQARLTWQSAESRVHLGRQEIVLGDQRFVGNVGWRQNHQSFDAITLSHSGWKAVSLFYGYLENVNRINGGHHEMGGHLLQVSLELGSEAQLTLYGYLLDYEERPLNALSTATHGVEITGSHSMSTPLKLLYELEYAEQGDYGDNPETIDAGYLFGSVGVASRLFSLKLGYEVLEGNRREGQFNTPLATLHKFNGWADQFLRTPVDGLKDLYLEIGGKVESLDWTMRYHHFGAESGDGEYGEELDLQLLYQTPWKLGLGLKGALYDAEKFAEDTDKWMVWANWKI